MRDGNLYRIRDPLFEGWINKLYLGLDKLMLKDKKVFERMFSELQEKYVRASTEVDKGIVKEFK